MIGFIKILATAVAGCLLAGCVTEGTTRVPLTVHNVALMQMQETRSVVQKRRIASLTCRRAGYTRLSAPHHDCMRALIARDVRRTGDRADALFRLSAQRHGVCIRRETYTVVRCLEI